jgi:hypothetical protein
VFVIEQTLKTGKETASNFEGAEPVFETVPKESTRKER